MSAAAMRTAGWRRLAAVATAILAVAVLSACSGRDADLDHFIQNVKQQPGGHIQPLPIIKPYDAFVYADRSLRSPFVPGGGASNNGVRPDSRRNREYLEQFPLDTLKMVGTLNLGGQRYGLVLTRDGRVHRVVVGNHMGQNDGKITDITASKISLTEIVPDGLGGYLERPAALALE